MSVISKYIHEAPEDDVDELIANNDIAETQLNPNEQENTAPQDNEIQVDDDYLQQDPEENPNEGEEEGMDRPEEEPPTEMQMIDNNMFADLSSTELAARDRKLRQDLATLYDLCNIILNRVIFINKNEQVIKISEYISGKMEDMKDRIVDYLNYIYDSNSYIENMVYYKQCYSLLQGIALILQEIEPKEENK